MARTHTGSRKVEVVTALAVRRATASELDVSEVADELVDASDGSWPVVMASLVRVDRALTSRWSRVASNAADALRIALVRIERDRAAAA